MNMVNHNFFMFKNADTDEINVVYKRENGDYGLWSQLFKACN